MCCIRIGRNISRNIASLEHHLMKIIGELVMLNLLSTILVKTRSFIFTFYGDYLNFDFINISVIADAVQGERRMDDIKQRLIVFYQRFLLSSCIKITKCQRSCQRFRKKQYFLLNCYYMIQNV